jgi:hypothetical protein
VQFDNEEGQQQLRRVLRAYAAYDPDVGYCQGMNFLAALLLMYLPREEDAFGALVMLMFEQGLRVLYSRSMVQLQVGPWPGKQPTLGSLRARTSWWWPALPAPKRGCLLRMHACAACGSAATPPAPQPSSAWPQVQLWLLSQLMPADLGQHLEECCVPPVLYAASWLMTCFSADFPISFSARWAAGRAQAWGSRGLDVQGPGGPGAWGSTGSK